MTAAEQKYSACEREGLAVCSTPTGTSKLAILRGKKGGRVDPQRMQHNGRKDDREPSPINMG